MGSEYTKDSHSIGELFSFGNDDELRFATEFQQLLNIKDPKEIAPFMRAITGNDSPKGFFGYIGYIVGLVGHKVGLLGGSRTTGQGWTIINNFLNTALEQVRSDDYKAREPIKSGICRIVARALFPYAASFEKQKKQEGTIITPNTTDFAKKEHEWLQQLPKIGEYIRRIKESSDNDTQFVKGIAVLARAMQAHNLDEPRSIVESGTTPNTISSFLTMVDFIRETLKETGDNCDGLQTCLFKICMDIFNLDVTKNSSKLIEAYKEEKTKIEATIQNIKTLEAAIQGQPQDRIKVLTTLLEKYALEEAKESLPEKKSSLLSKVTKIKAAMLSKDDESIKELLEKEVFNIGWNAFEWSGKSTGKPFEFGMPIKNLDKYNAAFDFFDRLLIEKMEGSRDKLLATLPVLEKNLKIRQERLAAKGGNPEEQLITAKMESAIIRIKALKESTRALQSAAEILGSLAKYHKSMKPHTYEATISTPVEIIEKSLHDKNMLFPNNELIRKLEVTDIKKHLSKIGALRTKKQTQKAEKRSFKNERKTLIHALKSTQILLKAAKNAKNMGDDNLIQSITYQVNISDSLKDSLKRLNDPSKASEILTAQANFLKNEITSKINSTAANLRSISTLEKTITTLKEERSKLSIWPWWDRAKKTSIMQQINAKKDEIKKLNCENKQLAKEFPALLKQKAKELKVQIHQKEREIATKSKEIYGTSKDIYYAIKKLHREATQHLQELSTFVAEVRMAKVAIPTTVPDVSLATVSSIEPKPDMKAEAKERDSMGMGPSGYSVRTPSSPQPLQSSPLFSDGPPPLFSPKPSSSSKITHTLFSSAAGIMAFTDTAAMDDLGLAATTAAGAAIAITQEMKTKTKVANTTSNKTAPRFFMMQQPPPLMPQPPSIRITQ